MEFEKTTREQRRQTLAKLVLGHLVDVRIYTAPPRSEWKAEVHHYSGEFIACEDRANWPSELLCAKVALALDERAYQSCDIRDLDDHTLDVTLGDSEPIIPWGAPR